MMSVITSFHPASVDISFKGLRQNGDSLYTDDMKARFRDSVGAYDKLASY